MIGDDYYKRTTNGQEWSIFTLPIFSCGEWFDEGHLRETCKECMERRMIFETYGYLYKHISEAYDNHGIRRTITF